MKIISIPDSERENECIESERALTRKHSLNEHII